MNVDGTKLRELAQGITDEVGEDVGIILIVFKKDEDKENTMTQYISNVKKESVIRFLLETATRMMNGTTFEPPTDN